ncbi:MAG: type I-MYXAN CRISPR-associated protein Cas6/Cmx6 [Cyanobacteria bacterium]|nr:type I-MYXAN CRISPR-associated protein Cas6/Cmx6 [Cyanobacteriota bacterium]MDW8199775.1 type I-MYXAN CRISPR-associated protein Cas6/Cmx6 [Cyanobacteriota bacterium SKYGB_h_bin112]
MEFLEVQFSLRGRTLPADHGYSLYSAIKQTLKELEQGQVNDAGVIPPEVLISSIPGIPDRDGMIYLNRYSRLRLRCPSDQAKRWYRLQNQVLDIQGHLIRLIQPRLMLPQPGELLKARLVTFKLTDINHNDVPRYFLESCKRALDSLEIQGNPFIDSNEQGDLARRTITIKQKKVLGYGIGVDGLSAADSIKLQCLGLGGRKHFGCGWFYAPRDQEVA